MHKINQPKIFNLFKILNSRERISLLLLFILSIIIIFIELITISSIPVLFSQLLNFKTNNEIIDQIINYISYNSNDSFYFIIVAIIIIFFLRSLFLYVAKIFEFIVFKRIRLRLSEYLLGNFLSSNLIIIQKDTPANKIWKMEIINNLAGVIDDIITLLKNFGFIFVIFLFFLSYVGVQIIYFFGALIFFTLIFYLFFSNLIKKIGALTDIASKNKINVIQNIMNGIKDIFILNKFNFFKNQFKKFNLEYEKNTQKSVIIHNIPIYFLEFIGILFICLFTLKLYIGDVQVEKIISIISVLAYGGIRLVGVLKMCIVRINSYKKNSFVINVILEELKKRNNNNYTSNISYQKLQNQENFIEIKKLSFAYDKNNLLINNVSFDFKKNKIYALLGESGSGKSTFLDLLLGIYESNKDNIKINCLKEEVGYVPQESYLSSGTIKENVAFGQNSDQIDLEKINSCLKKAEIYDFVYSLPNKIDSHLSIFGSNISVGQKQRIGIARALYNDPKIILLDEPTSALDNNTEKDFINTLQDLKKDRLIIMTTHKKSFIDKFDIVLNLKDKTLQDTKNI